MNQFLRIRLAGAYTITVILWLCTAWLFLASPASMSLVGVSAAISAIITLLAVTKPFETFTRMMMAVALVGSVSLVVAAYKMNPFQIDYHMYYFAFLAITVVLLDWRAVLVFCVVTAVHHLSLNFLLPYFIFPEGANFFRVVLHAVAVVIEGGVLMWVVFQMEAVFKKMIYFDKEIQRLIEEKQLSYSFDVKQNSPTALLEERMNSFLSTLHKFISSVGQKSNDVSNAVREINQKYQALEAGAKNQEDSSHRIAAAIEETSSNIVQIAGLTSSNKEKLSAATKSIESSMTNMEQLQESTRQVSDMANVIQDISEQINLLALNASIEAARAGDAGRGFSVVADEVKKLATHVASSAHQIQETVGRVLSSVELSVTSMKGIQADVTFTNEGFQSVDTAMQEQKVAVEDITETVASFSSNLQEMVVNITEMQKQVSLIAKESESLSKDANTFS